MQSSSPFEFPSRPFTIQEVLDLKHEVETYKHTTPMIGLAAKEPGQSGDGKAVVGIYLGFGGGAHLSGFNPDTNEWESVSTVSPQDFPDPDVMRERTAELMEWLSAQYPGEKFVMYEGVNPRSN